MQYRSFLFLIVRTMINVFTLKKNDFEVFKNLARYKSKNNFVIKIIT